MYAASTSESLDFAKAKTNYATHGMHSFSAKFPPQLAGWGIEKFTEPGEIVLDPMCGSGTTLVEAALLGRNSLGADIDPLARLISQVKSTPLDPVQLRNRCDLLLTRFSQRVFEWRRLRSINSTKFPLDLPDFPNRDYWFSPEVSEELVLLKDEIQRIEGRDFQNFFYLVFSSLIITKGKTSVANVRDLAHSRPHYARPDKQPDVLEIFSQKLRRLSDAMIAFTLTHRPETRATITGKDAGCLPVADNFVDLVFTSPPYVNAIDYQRAHKFSLFWLGDVLSLSPDEYTRLGREYVGTDRVPLAECNRRVNQAFGLPLVDSIIKDIADLDVKRAGVAHRYFESMQRIMAECARVLRPQKRAVFVVCPSRIRSIDVPTHKVLIEIGENLKRIKNDRLVFEDMFERALDDSKRQLPFIRGEFGPGMRTEYVVVLRKDF
jgi:DNA modification methylase